MEAETVDSYPRNYSDYPTILAYSQGGAQAGEYCDMFNEDLFTTTMQYDFYLNHCFRPLNIEGQQTMDLSPVNLGPSKFNLHRSNAKVAFGGQREQLRTTNILRPRSLTNNQHCIGASDNNEFIYASENGKNSDFATLDGRAFATGGGAYTTLPDQSHTEVNCQAWIQNPEYNSYGEATKAEINLVDGVQYNWIHRESPMVATNGGKAVNAADQLLEPARPENGLAFKRVDHLDGPVSPMDVTEEADAGQMADCYSASSEFECDGNSFTSLTDNSME